MATSVLSGVLASVAGTLSDILIAKPFTLAWRWQKIHDAYHFCHTMWRLSQPHGILGTLAVALKVTKTGMLVAF